MDSLLDDSTSSAGGILQSGTVTKVVEEEECQHHANAPTTGIDATSAASTKIAISKDKGGIYKSYFTKIFILLTSKGKMIAVVLLKSANELHIRL